MTRRRWWDVLTMAVALEADLKSQEAAEQQARLRRELYGA